jgi:hypothetical protein
MFLNFVNRPIFPKTHWKMNLFPSSGKIMESPTLLGPIEKDSL